MNIKSVLDEIDAIDWKQINRSVAELELVSQTLVAAVSTIDFSALGTAVAVQEFVEPTDWSWLSEERRLTATSRTLFDDEPQGRTIVRREVTTKIGF